MTTTVRVHAPLRPGQRKPKRVSLPALSMLADDPRYREGDQLRPEPARPRLAPTLRMLIKMARRRRDAEELGRLLRRRYGQRGEGVNDIELEAMIERLQHSLMFR